MIKKSFKVLFLIILAVAPLTGCADVLNPYQDKLYSEKIISGNETTSTKTSNMLTRESAIKKTLELFDKGLGIKINRTDFTENIKLVRNDIVGNLQWRITWYKNPVLSFYSCTLDSSTGEIVYLDHFENSESNNSTIHNLSIPEITNLINPILIELGIDINNYKIIKLPETPYNRMKILLYDTKKGVESYILYIDLVSKTVSNFEKFHNK